MPVLGLVMHHDNIYDPYSAHQFLEIPGKPQFSAGSRRVRKAMICPEKIG